MVIGDRTVITPYENRIEYDSDWRHQAAFGLASTDSEVELPAEIENDPYVREHCQYLRQFNTFAPAAEREYPLQSLTSKWYTRAEGSTAKFYLDALLLTNQPLDVIADDMGVDVETVQLYERLYFSCRQDDGEPLQGCYLKTHMAVGPLLELTGGTPRQIGWRAIAMQTGYTALVYTWGWRDAHGDLSTDVQMFKAALRMSHGRVLDSIMRGTIEMVDILGVIGNYINYERHLFDTGKSQAAEGASQGLDLLKVIAPKMLTMARSQDAGLEHRRLAEGEILKAEAGDKGLPAGIAQLNEQLNRHFKGAKQEIARAT